MASGLLVFFVFLYFAFLPFHAHSLSFCLYLVDYLQLLSVVAAAATTAIIVIVIVVLLHVFPSPSHSLTSFSLHFLERRKTLPEVITTFHNIKSLNMLLPLSFVSTK